MIPDLLPPPPPPSLLPSYPRPATTRIATAPTSPTSPSMRCPHLPDAGPDARRNKPSRHRVTAFGQSYNNPTSLLPIPTSPIGPPVDVLYKLRLQLQPQPQQQPLHPAPPPTANHLLPFLLPPTHLPSPQYHPSTPSPPRTKHTTTRGILPSPPTIPSRHNPLAAACAPKGRRKASGWWQENLLRT